MAEATITSKWQMVLPKAVREHLKVHPGDRVDFVILDSGEVMVRPAVSDVRELKGILYDPDRQPVSLAAMDEAVRRRGGRRE